MNVWTFYVGRLIAVLFHCTVCAVLPNKVVSVTLESSVYIKLLLFLLHMYAW